MAEQNQIVKLEIPYNEAIKTTDKAYGIIMETEGTEEPPMLWLPKSQTTDFEAVDGMVICYLPLWLVVSKSIELFVVDENPDLPFPINVEDDDSMSF